MPVKTGEYLTSKDIFIDYDFEKVMFRRDHVNNKIYLKFYGEDEHPQPVPHDNRLYNDALRFGDEITREEYIRGKST